MDCGAVCSTIIGLPIDCARILSASNITGQHRIVNVGILYKPRTGESLQLVAERLHTTVRSLLMLNPDLETKIHQAQAAVEWRNGEGEGGEALCVIPCSLDGGVDESLVSIRDH